MHIHSLYIYIHMHLLFVSISICSMRIYMYIYIYIYRERERDSELLTELDSGRSPPGTPKPGLLRSTLPRAMGIGCPHTTPGRLRPNSQAQTDRCWEFLRKILAPYSKAHMILYLHGTALCAYCWDLGSDLNLDADLHPWAIRALHKQQMGHMPSRGS